MEVCSQIYSQETPLTALLRSDAVVAVIAESNYWKMTTCSRIVFLAHFYQEIVSPHLKTSSPKCSFGVYLDFLVPSQSSGPYMLHVPALILF